MIAKEIMARMTARFQLIGENLVPRYVASNNRRLVVVSNRVAVEGPKPDTGGLGTPRPLQTKRVWIQPSCRQRYPLPAGAFCIAPFYPRATPCRIRRWT